jgi:phospholipase C
MSEPIRHVFVLMLENRSFDQMLGAVPGFDGVNPAIPKHNVLAPGSVQRFLQAPTAARKHKPDPGHSCENVIRQIDGAGLGPMGAFVFDFGLEHPGKALDHEQIMAYYPLGELTALHQLAQSYCVSDRWFSSVPGPTWTNRFFVHSGTSLGRVLMPSVGHPSRLRGYNQRTIYNDLTDNEIDWRIYYGDIPQALALREVRRLRSSTRLKHFRNFEDDIANASDNDFPAYVFIEPDYFLPGQNDQHPPSNVHRGDALIARVYNAMIGNNELWQSSLLIIVYDEHGGFYDHVLPPAAAPPDDMATEGFSFDRAGVRVPAVLVSPRLKSRVFRPADGQLLDHTSILRLLADQYGLDPLGARTATAASLAGALTDATSSAKAHPIVLPANVLKSLAADAESTPVELSDNQQALLDMVDAIEEDELGPDKKGRRSPLRNIRDLPERIENARLRVQEFVESVQQFQTM